MGRTTLKIYLLDVHLVGHSSNPYLNRPSSFVIMHQTMKKSDNSKQIHSLFDLVKSYKLEDKGGYITKEFQDYGYRLALDMGEESKKSLYIKLAKTTDRKLLERARSYVLDAPNVNSRGRLFMWALSRLKKGLPLTPDNPVEPKAKSRLQ